MAKIFFNISNKFFNGIFTPMSLFDQDSEPEKFLYSIGEVSEMFKVNASLIRFWEKEFDIIRPQKNKKGNRLFTRDDIKNFQIIFELVKEKGYTLQGAKQYLSNRQNKNQIDSEKAIKKHLQDLHAKLLDLKSQLT